MGVYVSSGIYGDAADFTDVDDEYGADDVKDSDAGAGVATGDDVGAGVCVCNADYTEAAGAVGVDGSDEDDGDCDGVCVRG